MEDRLDIDLTGHGAADRPTTDSIEASYIYIRLTEHDKRLDCHDRKFGAHAEVHSELRTGINDLHNQMQQQREHHAAEMALQRQIVQAIRENMTRFHSRTETMHLEQMEAIGNESQKSDYRTLFMFGAIICASIVVLFVTTHFK